MGVTCKIPACELLIEETDKSAWGFIFEGLIKQDWWKFSSTNSTSRSGENKTHLIYLLMSA
jgi:hypothetical protein